MKVRRIAVFAFCSVVVANAALPTASLASSDKQLERVRGVVGYRAAADGPLHQIVGRLDLADDAWAVTENAAAALLRLADSSEIELGEKTVVQVGAFNTAQSGAQNTIVVEHGALHFKIRHPAGMRSNYVFQTGTSQIAVRGTEAYVVSGPRGTQVFCVECTPGDVAIRTGARVITIVTGQTATILGASAANAAITVGANATLHNPALDQFVASHTALAANPAVIAADPTGVVGGGVASAGAGAAAGTVAAAAAAAAGVAVAAGASHASSGTTTTSTPPPTPTTVQFVTTVSTPTPTPTATPQPTATPTSAAVVFPTPTPTPTPTPAPTPTPTPNYGTLYVSPMYLTLTSQQPTGSFGVQQSGPSGTITMSVGDCRGDVDSLSISPSSAPVGPSRTTVTVSATGHGKSGAKGDCTIRVQGIGGATATVSVSIDVNHGNSKSDDARARSAAPPAPSPTPGPHH
jgi:hypothetical protein